MDTNFKRRSKKALIEGINNVGDVMAARHSFVSEKHEKVTMELIKAKNLFDMETRKFVDNAFRDG